MSAHLELGLILNSGNVFTLLGFCFSDDNLSMSDQWVKVHGKLELFIHLILCNNYVTRHVLELINNIPHSSIWFLLLLEPEFLLF